MANAEKNPHDQMTREELKSHRTLYQGMMTFGMGVGLPVGGAIAMFVILLLLGQGIVLTVILSVLTWLGLKGIADTFFIH